MQNGKDYVTQEEFNMLRSEVEDLARTVNTFVDHSSRYIDVLLANATGQLPAQSVSLETHNKVVKGLISAFSVIVVVAVGAVKILPYVMGNTN